MILFVPDGLRAKMVDRTNAPALDALQRAGVTFANSHSIFPTFTTANAAAMSTGHYLGDTGDFSNTVYAGVAQDSVSGLFIEVDAADSPAKPSDYKTRCFMLGVGGREAPHREW